MLVVIWVPCCCTLLHPSCSVHGEIGSLSVMGVSRESHDTVVISTPETREVNGNQHTYMMMMSFNNNDIITGDISPLAVVQFDMNPLGMSTDFMLCSSLNPLEIIYDAVSYILVKVHMPCYICYANIYEFL